MDEGSLMPLTRAMTLAGMAVTVLVGSLLTAQQVLQGDPLGAFILFALSVSLGGYYLVLYHVTRGRRIRQFL